MPYPGVLKHYDIPLVIQLMTGKIFLNRERIPIFRHFFLSSCVNSNIGNHTINFKSCVDNIKILCRCRQVRKDP